mmetsp:Transcript_22702/g.25265  ORF Transcript_22702/g.25265 Transcript_22702/m.25265 type:complete len:150 (-) Transcript_22702:68-517(-)
MATKEQKSKDSKHSDAKDKKQRSKEKMQRHSVQVIPRGDNKRHSKRKSSTKHENSSDIIVTSSSSKSGSKKLHNVQAQLEALSKQITTLRNDVNNYKPKTSSTTWHTWVILICILICLGLQLQSMFGSTLGTTSEDTLNVDDVSPQAEL